MKKQKLALTVILAALLGLSFPTQAQVFIQEEDMGTNNRVSRDGEGLGPGHGGDTDLDPDPVEYTPLGSGALILGCLGGAYLLGRRRKERE